jgi:hypothetical protein
VSCVAEIEFPGRCKIGHNQRRGEPVAALIILKKAIIELTGELTRVDMVQIPLYGGSEKAS